MAFNNVPVNGWPQLKNLPSGSNNYADLSNKPQINSVTLSGNKSLDDIGAAAKTDIRGEFYDSSEKIIGTWFGQPLYRKCFTTTMPNNANKKFDTDLLKTDITPRKIGGIYGTSDTCFLESLPYSSTTTSNNVGYYGIFEVDETTYSLHIINAIDQSNYTAVLWVDYTKISENPSNQKNKTTKKGGK